MTFRIASFVLTAMAMADLSSPVSAQTQMWYASSGSWYAPSGINIGIGTPAPAQKLDVADSNAIRLGAAYISSGIPTVNHAVFASNALFNGSSWVIPSNATTSQALQFYGGETFFLQTQTPGSADWQFRMIIANNGYVGIGTVNPPYKLSVNGAIGANEVVIVNTTGWSDYVFQPGYRLRPLREVNAYIQANHHLPDVPSEAEVKEKGISIGEMQAKLLAKVEELTLHMIQADERNSRLEQQNQELRHRIARLEKAADGVTR